MNFSFFSLMQFQIIISNYVLLCKSSFILILFNLFQLILIWLINKLLFAQLEFQEILWKKIVFLSLRLLSVIEYVILWIGELNDSSHILQLLIA